MLRAHVAVYNLDGSLAYEHETKLTAAPDVATDLGPIDFPATVSRRSLHQARSARRAGQLISTNFYWRAQPDHPDDLDCLESTAHGHS